MLLLLLVIAVATQRVTGSVDLHQNHALKDVVNILEMLAKADPDIKFSHCALTKDFLSTANSLYGCQKIQEQNPICNRSLIVAFSPLEPLVYQNESGHVVGILPGTFNL